MNPARKAGGLALLVVLVMASDGCEDSPGSSRAATTQTAESPERAASERRSPDLGPARRPLPPHGEVADAEGPLAPLARTVRAVPRGKIRASDALVTGQFASAVAVSGNSAVVGAYGNGDYTSSGAAYVFVRSGPQWTEQAKLLPQDPEQEQFGLAVAISGETVLIAAPYDDAGVGSVYVFVRSGASWARQAKLVSGNTAPSTFGASVALSGDTAVIGAPQDSDVGAAAGAAYVFVRSGTRWTKQAKIVAADGVANDNFGAAVAVHDETLFAGSCSDLDDPGRGCAYVFVRSGATWSQQAKLALADGQPGDTFGSALSVRGDTAVVGAPTSQGGSGTAHVFTRSGAAWSLRATLVAPDGAPDAFFGTPISIMRNGRVLVSAPGTDGAVGAAYVFEGSGATWSARARLSAPDGAGGDSFGFWAGGDGDNALIGAANHMGTGAAYAYEIAECAANSECASNFCVDGVCCNEACGGGDPTDCRACSVSAGAAVDGTCAPVLASAHHACRPAAGPCDSSESCNGTDLVCPADTLAPDGTTCSGQTLCKRADTCNAGACSPGAVVACDDGNPCTVDACEIDVGCVSTPAADGIACDGGTCIQAVCSLGGNGDDAGGNDAGEFDASTTDAGPFDELAPRDESGCSCRSWGGQSSAQGSFGAGLAALGFAFARRRRRALRGHHGRRGGRGA